MTLWGRVHSIQCPLIFKRGHLCNTMKSDTLKILLYVCLDVEVERLGQLLEGEETASWRPDSAKLATAITFSIL